MHAKYEHSPPTSSRSTSVIVGVGLEAAQRPANASPVEPPPSTTTASLTAASNAWATSPRVGDGAEIGVLEDPGVGDRG